MSHLAVLLDSNLLLLLMVSITSPDYIPRHKRLRAFSVDDFALLQKELRVVTEIVVTPNTLSETSNLIDHINDPARTRIYQTLRRFLRLPGGREAYVSSEAATAYPELPRLGLTDCALLDLCMDGIPLLTVDLRLYLAVLGRGGKALNFNHLRDPRQ